MKVGILKSKIEKKLVDSYKTNKLNENLKVFKKLVLENKRISNLFFIYDEMSSKKGFGNKEKANDYINECVKIYENNYNKVSLKEWKKLMSWVGETNVENQYDQLDTFFNSDILQIENKVESKNIIVENLIQSENKKAPQVNLPIKTMVNVVNTTINKHIEKLDEETKKELKSLFEGDVKELEKKYLTIKEEVVTKLESLKNTSDTDTNNRIDQSIKKIQTEKFDKLNFYKLKTLNESI
jgi:hypothetical protein